MTITDAPFYDDIAGGTPEGGALWVTASDDVRIRIGHWRPENARGTVLMFPGRTEYVEKYSGAAQEFARRGYASIAIDWRGQGLADRLLDDPRVGHVDRIVDYQKDIAAALRVVRHLDLPRPWHMLGHSMGGGIGLRAVMEGLPVQTCAFTGPMWGIRMSALLKPFGWALSFAAPVVGMGGRLPPSTRYENYVLAEEFKDNILTTDPEMFELMRHQLQAHPDLALGGPSLIWLREALVETRHLAARPSPDIPCVTFLGDSESIVDTQRVHDRMAIWPKGELVVLENAEHEVLMETARTRKIIYDRLDQLFSGANDTAQDVRTA